MPAKLVALTVVLVTMIGMAAAQPAPKTADDKALVTKVYDIKPLLGERGKANHVADADAVIKLLVETVPLGDMKPGSDGAQLVELDGGKLEIRTTAKRHEEVKDLLDALDRLMDVAVDVRADVIELDPAAFEKLQKAFPNGKAGSPVVFTTGDIDEEKFPEADRKALAEANAILKSGRVVQTSQGRFVNGAESPLAARHSVLSFHPGIVNNKPSGTPQFVKEGFKLIGVLVVSADRRFVRLKLTEQAVVVGRMNKRDAGEPIEKQKLVLQSPELEDRGATGSAVVDDGGTLVFRLAYAPKGKVWVVVLKPRIFIQAEEDEVKKQEKK